jgi:tungstate transport system permease protein
MPDLGAATWQALVLLFSGDAQLWEIVGVSFWVSTKAVVVAGPVAVLAGFALAHFRFRGRRVLLALINTFMAVPAVVVGLTVYLFLARNGPLGDLRLLFTQTAMVIGQILLCLPLVTALAHAALQAVDQRAWETAVTLGAGAPRAVATVLYEARFGIVGALLAGFGRVIAEVGSSLMVGGNILHVTRNIPTAIALETSKGEFAQGIALGMVLLVLALGVNFALGVAQGRGEMRL